MQSFAEFESTFLGALQQERSDLQTLQGASEAQLTRGLLPRGWPEWAKWARWMEIA
jgi:hypothetical protein